MEQGVGLVFPCVHLLTALATPNESDLFRFKSALSALFTLGKYNLHVAICEERFLNSKGLRDKQQSLVAMHGVQNVSAEPLRDLFKGF